MTNGLTEAFTALHPNITFDIENRPGGADGDNIVKTRLSTGEMSDVFFYNSGSLMQALNPEESMVEITGDPMLDDVVDAFIPTVTQNGKVFGVPFGTGMGGGVLYNRAIFEEQGLEVPLTWEEFAANNDALKEAGVTPVGASFGTTWTSQLFVLADYHNVAAGRAQLRRGVHGEPGEVRHDSGRTHRASSVCRRPPTKTGGTRTTGRRRSRTPRRCCSTARSLSTRCSRSHCRRWRRSIPTKVQDIGFFAQPGPDAETNGMTLWMPAGAYIAATTDHVDEAKEFLAFIASVEGTEAMTAAAAPAGPYLIEGSSLPDDALPAVKDVEGYIESGNVDSCARVPVADQGPQPRAHHRRGRLRSAHC